jgi:hypothetical protein
MPASIRTASRRETNSPVEIAYMGPKAVEEPIDAK